MYTKLNPRDPAPRRGTGYNRIRGPRSLPSLLLVRSNPHPGRNPGATDGRRHASGHAASSNPHPGRNPGATATSTATCGLPMGSNPHPGRNPGATSCRALPDRRRESSNPHPGRNPGATGLPSCRGPRVQVPILTRVETRVQLDRKPDIPGTGQVPILTRVETRVQPPVGIVVVLNR